MVREEVLEQIHALLKEMYASDRWRKHNHPCTRTIPHIGERVSGPESVQTFVHGSADDAYLLHFAHAFEEALNDDWLPDDVVGLPLKKAHRLLGRLVADFHQVPKGQWRQHIAETMREIGS